LTFLFEIQSPDELSVFASLPVPSEKHQKLEYIKDYLLSLFLE